MIDYSLRATVPVGNDESTLSAIGRGMKSSGIKGIETGCGFYGLRWKQLIEGNKVEIVKAAAILRLPKQILIANAWENAGRGAGVLKGQPFSRKSVLRQSPTFCPHCYREDLERKSDWRLSCTEFVGFLLDQT